MKVPNKPTRAMVTEKAQKQASQKDPGQHPVVELQVHIEQDDNGELDDRQDNQGRKGPTGPLKFSGTIIRNSTRVTANRNIATTTYCLKVGWRELCASGLLMHHSP